jgi:hypothetical protein
MLTPLNNNFYVGLVLIIYYSCRWFAS